jgi:hypothetical protein
MLAPVSKTRIVLGMVLAPECCAFDIVPVPRAFSTNAALGTAPFLALATVEMTTTAAHLRNAE